VGGIHVTPYYTDDLVTIYHGDNREWTVPPGMADALVSDPPYGMGWETDLSRFSGGAQKVKRGQNWGSQIAGDDEPFDPSRWLDYPEVILWGANHFGRHLPVGTTLVWIKRYDAAFGSFLSDAEVAWMKGGHGVYCFRETGYKGNEERYHPTQKPLALMRWCVGKTTASTIVDPFMGSGSTLVAAKSLGRRAIGIEIEEKYCEIAAMRCSQEVLGLLA
jgi:site-specific DNA-methyltransferase (adenine-specific)